MLIKKTRIQNYGNIEEMTAEPSSGINAVCSDDREKKLAFLSFFGDMLYGKTAEPENNGGILWFHSGVEDFRLTRNFSEKKPYHELRSDTTGAITDAEKGSLDRVTGSIGEEIFQAVSVITPPVSSEKKILSRDIQNTLTGTMFTKDGAEDLGRALQILKMSRKGYQSEIDKRKRELVTERAKISEEMRRLDGEIEELRAERKSRKSQSRQSDDSSIETQLEMIRRRSQIAAIVIIIGALLCILFAVFMDQGIGLRIASLLGAVCFVLARVAWTKKDHTDIEKLKKQREHQRQKQSRAAAELKAVENEFNEKAKKYVNLRAEYREYEAALNELIPENTEVDAINSALESIEELSEKSYKKMRTRLERKMSDIFRSVSDVKYSRVAIDETMELFGIRGGDKIPLDKMEQEDLLLLYFSLRMAIGETLPEEPYPVLIINLPELFTEKSLKAVLRWMDASKRQFFVMSDRRKFMDLMDKNEIEYNKIIL